MPTNAILSRWAGGWGETLDATSITAYGRQEALLTIGAVQSIAEVERIALEQLSSFANPRDEIRAEIEPIDDTDRPYLAFGVADTVNVPAADLSPVAQRVTTISGEVDNASGKVRFVPEFKDVLLAPEERNAQTSKKMSDGTMRGETRVAQPVAAPPSPGPKIADIAADTVAWRLTGDSTDEISSGSGGSTITKLSLDGPAIAVGNVTATNAAPGHVTIAQAGYYDLNFVAMIEDYDDSRMAYCRVGEDGAATHASIAGTTPVDLTFYGGLFAVNPKNADATILLPNYGEGLQLFAWVEFDNGLGVASADVINAWWNNPLGGGDLGVHVAASFANSANGKVTVAVNAPLTSASGARLTVQRSGPNALTVTNSRVTANAEGYPFARLYFVRYVGGVTREVLRDVLINNHESQGECNFSAPLRLLNANDELYIEFADYTAQEDYHSFVFYDVEFAGRLIAT